MKPLRTGAVLLVVQVLLVLSVAGKYLYERKTRPRVWVRATQVDPESPLRGRYLALQRTVNACGLPRDATYAVTGLVEARRRGVPQEWQWEASIVFAEGGFIAVAKPGGSQADWLPVRLREDQPCDRAVLQEEPLAYYVPDHAQSPFPLKKGEELWVEVTVPPEGPPRPIQLAMADGTGFHVLHL